MNDGHKAITGITDISGDEFTMCLEGDRLYVEGGTLDLTGIAQLVAACDDVVRQIREDQAADGG
jgi:hypothetical protein